MHLYFQKRTLSSANRSVRIGIQGFVVSLLPVYVAGCVTALAPDLAGDGGTSSPGETEIFADSEGDETESSIVSSDSGDGQDTETTTDTETAVDTYTETVADSDSDMDQCPEDDNKTEPGICGCGIPEGTCVVPCAEGNGRVDPRTGLCWQEPKLASNSTWQQAGDYCAALSLGGLADWRLPTLDDFIELLGGCDPDLKVTEDGYCNPCADSPFCNHIYPLDLERYWSATAADAENAWIARLETGRLSPIRMEKLRFVRCVAP